MNYQIITDPIELKKFIDWLPDLKENEQFYGCLFARKKYCKSIPWPGSDKSQLKRFTAKKENLVSKIRQMECEVGSYEIKGQAIPQDALALYLHVNPRDLWKATIRSIQQLAKVIECSGHNANPHQEVLSEIQKSVGTKKYIVFDLDDKDSNILKKCVEKVDKLCDVIETRGGYHIFVHTATVKQITNKCWYRELEELCDVVGDNMSPVPGTYQGGFTPRFIGI